MARGVPHKPECGRPKGSVGAPGASRAETCSYHATKAKRRAVAWMHRASIASTHTDTTPQLSRFTLYTHSLSFSLAHCFLSRPAHGEEDAQTDERGAAP